MAFEGWELFALILHSAEFIKILYTALFFNPWDKWTILFT